VDRPPQTETDLPSRRDAAVFRAKAVLLQARRFSRGALKPAIARAVTPSPLQNAELIAESVSELWTGDTPEEIELTAGKVQNLRVALSRIDGIEVGAGETFSFWKQV
jgi:vancomycin resistance protein VanW